MLSPFTPLLPRSLDGIGYEDLARAAKALRVDPEGYRPVDGVEYVEGTHAVWQWDMGAEGGPQVRGLLGLFPLADLVPHEATTPAALTRPRHPVQIRPVMALVDDVLPELAPIGDPVVFQGRITHRVTPVATEGMALRDAVIADGHHRTAAALRAGGDPSIMVLVVSSTTAALDAGSFHRAFAHPVELPASIEASVIVREDPFAALAAGRIGVVTPAGSIGIDPGESPSALAYRGIPAGWVHHALLPVLGLDEDDAIYLDDPAAAASAGHYGTGILLPPSDGGAVVAAARSGLALPPKATRFRPKPLRGLAMRRL